MKLKFAIPAFVMLLALSVVLAGTVMIRDGELVLDKLDVQDLETDNLMADTDVLYVKDGHVGIGTSSPLTKLHVLGRINATGDRYLYCLAASIPAAWSVHSMSASNPTPGSPKRRLIHPAAGAWPFGDE